MGSLNPTLWRTCRVLANEKRLLCLKAVLEQPGSSVGDIAERVCISEALASELLRALQARGLIQAKRQSRWVYYSPKPDPLVVDARPLLGALKRALLVEGRSASEMIHALTAFTHPRRLEILRCLQKAAVDVSMDDLAASTRISLPALYRHLVKLTACELVSCDEKGWRLTRCPGRLEKTLLSFLAAD